MSFITWTIEINSDLEPLKSAVYEGVTNLLFGEDKAIPSHFLVSFV